MPKFEAGEIAVFAPDAGGMHLDTLQFTGMDVTVEGVMDVLETGTIVYAVVWPNGKTGTCIEPCLRKKRKPTWDDIQQLTKWRPNVHEHA